MKKSRWNILINLTAIHLVFTLNSEAEVIVNDAVIVAHPYIASNQVLYLTQSTSAGGLFGIEIANAGTAMFQFSYFGIAEEYGLFTVTLGTAFDPAFALAHDPIVSNNGMDPGSNIQAFALNQSKYFGYWDDRFNDRGPDSNDNYGWVRITRTASGLVASSSATAIGGGIVIGTTAQIPEPSASLLIVLSVGLNLTRRRRDSERLGDIFSSRSGEPQRCRPRWG